MARFNATLSQPRTATTNLAGGKAYTLSARAELATLVLTSFLENTFYESSSDRLKRLYDTINECDDLLWVAKLAIYARTEAGMRSISHAIAGYLPVVARSRGLASDSYGGWRFYSQVVHRVDDCAEIIAAYWSIVGKGKSLPSAMKQGIGRRLGSFSGHQLAKYKGESRDVKLVDVVNLTHPAPTLRNLGAFADLVAGKLLVSDTWESELSAAGRSGIETAVKKQEVWRDLISEGKVGHFALLRNLRNIIMQATPQTLKLALSQLTNEEAIRRSLVLPFRYFTAISTLQSDSMLPAERVREVVVALSVALDISVNNVPKIEGRTLVAVDRSGSMSSRISPKSETSMAEIASLFGAILARRSNADLMIFGDRAEYVPYNPMDSVATITHTLAHVHNRNSWGDVGGIQVGHGTNAASIFDAAGSTSYDRIIILSDMQSWMESHYDNYSTSKAYQAHIRRSGTPSRILSIDLSGHGTSLFPEPSIQLVSGWSERIFDFITASDRGIDAMIATIDEVPLGMVDEEVVAA